MSLLFRTLAKPADLVREQGVSGSRLAVTDGRLVPFAATVSNSDIWHSVYIQLPPELFYFQEAACCGF